MTAAIYWRVIGNTQQAVNCLRQALEYVPSDMKDVLLISLADHMHVIGFHLDALLLTYKAIEINPNFVLNHFTAGNVHLSLQDFGKAIAFYRASLKIDPNFEPARNMIQAVVCMFLFDERGTLRHTNFFQN